MVVILNLKPFSVCTQIRENHSVAIYAFQFPVFQFIDNILGKQVPANDVFLQK